MAAEFCLQNKYYLVDIHDSRRVGLIYCLNDGRLSGHQSGSGESSGEFESRVRLASGMGYEVWDVRPEMWGMRY